MSEKLRIIAASPLQPLESDTTLESANKIFWANLIGHIRKDTYIPFEKILDIGCHHGGLLEEIVNVLHPKAVIGVEPSSHCRERARFRLQNVAASVQMLSPERWNEIPTASIDLITCHEVLHLIKDVDSLFRQISRVLRPGREAFIVVGCHTENPLWERWSLQLENEGQTVFSRSPFEILEVALHSGLNGALRPLRRDGWIIYDPAQAEFKYDSLTELLNHQYRYKLLFRFNKP
ncbi:MAG TPA: class I SAM-dependent methyltransferase [Pyrinomonadaceae bacterium]|jgi:SAM-dependent methyltransferase|nr:class I SAM-dependent methyltransferase [Pyrinomonadaceae bacterium]